jgi:anthranilate synthase
MTNITFETAGGVTITRHISEAEFKKSSEDLIDRLDTKLGALFSSNYEYPGRYNRWEFGFSNPPLIIQSRGRSMALRALNARGEVLLKIIQPVLETLEAIQTLNVAPTEITLDLREPNLVRNEEERSRTPSVFSVLRAIMALFKSDEDSHLGLYGAFGYDLAFQFEAIDFKMERPKDQRDLVLFLIDELLVTDHYSNSAQVFSYEFAQGPNKTHDLDRNTQPDPFVLSNAKIPLGDHAPGEYADLVRSAKESFRRGDLFEVVPGQVFYENCVDSPAAIFRRLKQINPAPFGFLMNLGDKEFLVGASPEMFVRVTGRRVETCPISGTIARGADALEDSDQIFKLLSSEKDKNELTMCSDVDRNDKSRVCDPGSVRLIGRRQIELYSRLIHTVDHIEGRLREGLDAFDAFLSHAWAVTVTGAPKLWAMKFIEQHEKSTRFWYGGAVGAIGFDGNMNTGLTLRTIRIKNGVAEVRAGATLLNDSIPEDEEAETELKASAMRDAIRGNIRGNAPQDADTWRLPVGKGKRILLVDHEDSFVHTLANYVRQTGAEVLVTRSPVSEETWKDFQPDLLMMSPGPGRPQDFGCSATIEAALTRDIPIFGVCLGLQAIAEYFGATLDMLDDPVHGKPSVMTVETPGHIFADLPDQINVGRYHSLHALRDTMPADLIVTASTSDGVVMGIQHATLPVAAVQFHPESIMSLDENAGLRMIENAISRLTKGG